jgi:predicted aspartyl protease
MLLLGLMAIPSWQPVRAAQQAADFPITLTPGSRLMIDAAVNGVPVRALLDSAAEASLLDRGFAQRLKLGRGQDVTASGSGKQAFTASLVEGVTLQALGLTLKDQTVAVTDLGDVGRRLLHARLDMILGREIFDAARLSIDIDGRRIRVLRQEREPPGVMLALQAEHGVETIEARVEGGAPVRATFDLGNGAHVLVSRRYAQSRGFLTDGRALRKERGGGLGGADDRQVFTLRNLEIAGRRFENIDAAIDPQASASDLNVGISVLRHFHIVTDFSQRRVWLDPADAAAHR